MRAVIQRVSKASVSIGQNEKSSVQKGLLILLGIEHEDNREDALWLSKKISQLRIFDDAQGVMNLDILETGGELMVISQFTLHAKTKKGNRPSYIMAARPEQAIPLYEFFVDALQKETGKEIQTGEFGAEMKVALVNDGPVTIIIDTKNKE
jgi:D-aminoacyl-tRNA deacylase